MPPPRLKRSNTAGQVPASLADGEIAINQADGKLFYQTAAGGVSTFVATPADGSVTTAKIANGAVVTVDIADAAVTYAKVQNVSATDRLLGRSTAGAGVVEEIPCTAFGRSLINDAHAAEARTTLGLGTAFDGAAGTVSAPTFTFTSDTNTGVYSPGADQWAVTPGGVQRLSISAAGDVGIGVVAAANVRLYTYHTVANTTPTVCHQVIADPVSTVTGAYTTFGAYFVVRVDVAAGVTDSGAKRAMFVSALRNTKTASGTDAGTLLSLRGAEIQYGHSTVNTALTPTTTQVVGLMLAPYNGYGTVTDMYDLFINSDSHAFGAITNHYAIYQQSSTARSYFAGSVGIGASRTSPASALDVNGSITVTAGSATSPSICFHSDANNGLFAPAADTLAITTGGVERLRVDAAGDVGIGTTNPINNLHIRTAAQGFGGITVASPTRTLDVRPDSGAGSNNSIVQSGDTTLIFTAGAQGTGAFVIAPWAGTACGLRMDSSGNVGFGATSPTAPIDVAGNTIRIRTARTPASATATGSVGEVCWDESYLYICTATNTWRRIAHATW